MVIFTDEQYARLQNLMQQQRDLIRRQRGQLLTEEERSKLASLTRQLTDALANCQR